MQELWSEKRVGWKVAEQLGNMEMTLGLTSKRSSFLAIGLTGQ